MLQFDHDAMETSTIIVASYIFDGWPIQQV